MTIFKPEGLIVPDCKCFKLQHKKMESYIDKVSALTMIGVLQAADKISLCEKARDYYIAAFVWALVSALVKSKPDDSKNIFGPSKYSMVEYRKEFEEVYDRLRPLVMQRLDYVDGLVDSVQGRK